MSELHKTQVIDKEAAFQEAKKTISSLGYNTIQEMIADTLVLGNINISEQTWTETTDLSSVEVLINKAQAKRYGLEIINAVDINP